MCGQVLEHSIKSRWPQLEAEQKQDIKNTLCNVLLTQGTQPLGQEHPFIFNKVAAVVISMVKREWYDSLLPKTGHDADMAACVKREGERESLKQIEAG